MVESMSVRPLTGLSAYMLEKLGVSSSHFIIIFFFRVAKYIFCLPFAQHNDCKTMRDNERIAVSNTGFRLRLYRNWSERKVSFPSSHYYHQRHSQ